MAKTFMRGLELLEAVDVHGPLTVTELARVCGVDKSTVSRVLKACEEDGWVLRADNKVTLGPRAAMIGYRSSSGAWMRAVEPLVEAVAGVTGFTAQLWGLVGGRATALLSAGGRFGAGVAGLGASTPLYATAGGIALAAQLDAQELDRVLGPEPFPDPRSELAAAPGWAQFAGRWVDGGPFPEKPSFPADRAALDRRLAAARTDGCVIDRGDLHPDIGCIAVPWPRSVVPAALVCLGARGEVEAAIGRLRCVMAAAVGPGAAREDVIAAAVSARTAVATII